MTYEIEVAQVEPTAAVVARETVGHAGVGEFLGRAFGHVMAAVPMSAIAGPPFARYEVVGAEFRVEGGFPVQPGTEAVADPALAVIELPGGTVARTTHVGPYDQVAGAYQAIEAWFGETSRRPTGAPWETYLDEPTVERPRTLVTWPCE